jgi:hypothetical protein
MPLMHRTITASMPMVCMVSPSCVVRLHPVRCDDREPNFVQGTCGMSRRGHSTNNSRVLNHFCQIKLQPCEVREYYLSNLVNLQKGVMWYYPWRSMLHVYRRSHGQKQVTSSLLALPPMARFNATCNISSACANTFR